MARINVCDACGKMIENEDCGIGRKEIAHKFAATATWCVEGCELCAECQRKQMLKVAKVLVGELMSKRKKKIEVE